MLVRILTSRLKGGFDPSQDWLGMDFFHYHLNPFSLFTDKPSAYARIHTFLAITTAGKENNAFDRNLSKDTNYLTNLHVLGVPYCNKIIYVCGSASVTLYMYVCKISQKLAFNWQETCSLMWSVRPHCMNWVKTVINYSSSCNSKSEFLQFLP